MSGSVSRQTTSLSVLFGLIFYGVLLCILLWLCCVINDIIRHPSDYHGVEDEFEYYPSNRFVREYQHQDISVDEHIAANGGRNLHLKFTNFEHQNELSSEQEEERGDEEQSMGADSYRAVRKLHLQRQRAYQQQLQEQQQFREQYKSINQEEKEKQQRQRQQQQQQQQQVQEDLETGGLLHQILQNQQRRQKNQNEPQKQQQNDKILLQNPRQQASNQNQFQNEQANRLKDKDQLTNDLLIPHRPIEHNMAEKSFQDAGLQKLTYDSNELGHLDSLKHPIADLIGDALPPNKQNSGLIQVPKAGSDALRDIVMKRMNENKESWIGRLEGE